MFPRLQCGEGFVFHTYMIYCIDGEQGRAFFSTLTGFNCIDGEHGPGSICFLRMSVMIRRASLYHLCRAVEVRVRGLTLKLALYLNLAVLCECSHADFSVDFAGRALFSTPTVCGMGFVFHAYMIYCNDGEHGSGSICFSRLSVMIHRRASLCHTNKARIFRGGVVRHDRLLGARVAPIVRLPHPRVIEWYHRSLTRGAARLCF